MKQATQTKQIKKFLPTDRFLSINIYKFPLGNCGGITDVVKTIYIPCNTGPFEFSKIDHSLIFLPEQRGPNYFALKPLLQPIGLIGPMAGGNLAYSSDSRCPVVYHVHDRFEDEKTYEMLSR